VRSNHARRLFTVFGAKVNNLYDSKVASKIASARNLRVVGGARTLWPDERKWASIDDDQRR
jgi:hypothetical protein